MKKQNLSKKSIPGIGDKTVKDILLIGDKNIILSEEEKVINWIKKQEFNEEKEVAFLGSEDFGELLKIIEENQHHIKQAKEKIDKIINGGCGNEYLEGDDNWELMCGKHIWKDKGIIEELHLCEDCWDLKKEIDKIFKQEFGKVGE